MSVSWIPVIVAPFKKDNEKEISISLSKALMNRLGIEKKHKLHLCIGKKTKKIHIHVKESLFDEIHFSRMLLTEFRLPVQPFKLVAGYSQKKQILYLGPVVALVNDFHLDHSDEPHFGSIHAFCHELHQRIAETGGLFYIFHYKDFSETGCIGYSFEDGKWISSLHPLPDVIYNRIHSRKMEHAPGFKAFRSTIEKLDITFFNDRFLSKWEINQCLADECLLHPHIPETHLFSQKNLEDLLQKYSTVYIKPVHGSQGRNIFKLEKEETNIIWQTSQDPDSAKKAKKAAFADIFNELKPLLRNQIYIVQQGISLLEFQNRTMDFRVLVHKKQNRLWEVTSLVARISAEQQFVSNIAKGGEIMKPHMALVSCFSNDKAMELLSRIKELSIFAADAVSKKTKGLMGELGIDIGLDPDGKPWIIEVNSKPSKNSEDTPLKIRPSAKAIIQFCTKLAFDGAAELEE